MTGKVRPATAADFLAFFNASPPPIWMGLVYEENGPVAFGTIVWESWGHAIAFFHCRRAISKFTMQRVVKRVFRILRDVGEPAIYGVPDMKIPGAEKWMRRLGFQPTGFVPPGYTDEVWRLDLGEGNAASDP